MELTKERINNWKQKMRGNSRVKISDECLNDMVKEGFNTVQIAKTCGISRQAVHQRAPKNYKSYNSFHRHYEIIFLYKIGFTRKEIPNYINSPISEVDRILKKYRIKKPVEVNFVYKQSLVVRFPKKLHNDLKEAVAYMETNMTALINKLVKQEVDKILAKRDKERLGS